MGAAASVDTASSWASADAQKFIAPFLPLTIGKPKLRDDTALKASAQAKQSRNDAWRKLDNNGNGHVSLAETGKWIQDFLIDYYKNKEEGVRLYKAFYASYIRAFLDAADWGTDKKVKGTKTATTDDYVQRNEFRLLIAYLCIYAVMWDTFSTIDGGSEGATKDDDRRMTLEEFKAAVDKNKDKWGQHPLIGIREAIQGGQDDAENVFKQMDADGKGMVLLKEFCTYLEAAEVKDESELGKLLRASKDGDDEWIY